MGTYTIVLAMIMFCNVGVSCSVPGPGAGPQHGPRRRGPAPGPGAGARRRGPAQGPGAGTRQPWYMMFNVYYCCSLALFFFYNITKIVNVHGCKFMCRVPAPGRGFGPRRRVPAPGPGTGSRRRDPAPGPGSGQ